MIFARKRDICLVQTRWNLHASLSSNQMRSNASFDLFISNYPTCKVLFHSYSTWGDCFLVRKTKWIWKEVSERKSRSHLSSGPHFSSVWWDWSIFQVKLIVLPLCFFSQSCEGWRKMASTSASQGFCTCYYSWAVSAVLSRIRQKLLPDGFAK